MLNNSLSHGTKDERTVRVNYCLCTALMIIY